MNNKNTDKKKRKTYSDEETEEVISEGSIEKDKSSNSNNIKTEIKNGFTLHQREDLERLKKRMLVPKIKKEDKTIEEVVYLILGAAGKIATFYRVPIIFGCSVLEGSSAPERILWIQQLFSVIGKASTLSSVTNYSTTLSPLSKIKDIVKKQDAWKLLWERLGWNKIDTIPIFGAYRSKQHNIDTFTDNVFLGIEISLIDELKDYQKIIADERLQRAPVLKSILVSIVLVVGTYYHKNKDNNDNVNPLFKQFVYPIINCCLPNSSIDLIAILEESKENLNLQNVMEQLFPYDDLLKRKKNIGNNSLMNGNPLLKQKKNKRIKTETLLPDIGQFNEINPYQDKHNKCYDYESLLDMKDMDMSDFLQLCSDEMKFLDYQRKVLDTIKFCYDQSYLFYGNSSCYEITKDYWITFLRNMTTFWVEKKQQKIK